MSQGVAVCNCLPKTAWPPDFDKILFGKYSGTDIKIDGEEYLILREDEVLAVIG